VVTPDAPQPAPASDVLRQHALGLVHHEGHGLCPDPIEGPDVRDPQCVVCRALDATPAPTADAVERGTRAWFESSPSVSEPGAYDRASERMKELVRPRIAAALAAARDGEPEEPTREEYRGAYQDWQRHGRRLHDALLTIWRTLGEDRKYMTYGDDPQRVVDEYLAAQRGGEAEPSPDAEGALREAMTDVLAVAEADPEDAPRLLIESLRDLGWVLAQRGGEAVDREALDRVLDYHIRAAIALAKFGRPIDGQVAAAREEIAALAAGGDAAPTEVEWGVQVSGSGYACSDRQHAEELRRLYPEQYGALVRRDVSAWREVRP
jgi:hypothetical protein